MSAQGNVYSWCGCRDPATGGRLGSRCPRRGQRGHGSWYLSLELPPGPDGKRRRIRRGGFPTRRAAEKALARLRMPAGPEALVTTGEWLDRWLEQRSGPRTSTMRGYAAHVRLYLKPCLGRIPLADLTAAHVQAMFTAISRQHEAAGHPVTAATLARVRATLRAALNAAIRAGLTGVNAASLAEMPAPRRPRPVVWTATRVAEWQRTGIRPPVAVWTPAQTAQFLNAIRGHRLYAAYHLIALRGLRRGEAAGLRWCDIDLDSATAIITCQLQQYDGRLVLCPPKTVGSERAVALDRTTVAVLRAHKAAQDAERAALGKDYHDSGYVFTCLNGDPMAPDRLSRTFRRLADEAGLPPVRLHDLRHGAATLALAAKVDLKVVQDMLGHSSIVLTADTYTSVLPEVARKAAEDVASLIIAAGCLVPGTTRPRQPERLGHCGTRRQGSGSHAHPSRQVGRPRRADPDINKNRLSGTVPAWRRNVHTMQQPALGHPAIPRPTSAHTGPEMKTTWGAKPRVRTGAPPGTRTPNPRIKSRCSECSKIPPGVE
jgi:integrase